LDPLRIAPIHGITLDVVVKGQLSEKELSLESLHNKLPGTHQDQESCSASKISNLNADIQKSISIPQTVTPQEYTPATNKDFDEKMEKAESGDKDAQFEIGD
ncbi:hypothetical protein BGX24_008133, partial [Mortierella sp. AD032]